MWSIAVAIFIDTRLYSNSLPTNLCVFFQLNPQDLENEELVFGGTSPFTLQFEDLDRYEATSYVGRNKPVSCLLPSKEKGTLKASEFIYLVMCMSLHLSHFLKNGLHLPVTLVILIVLLIQHNFNDFNVCHSCCVNTDTSMKQSIYTQHFIMAI
jgi:hypothetical protein